MSRSADHLDGEVSKPLASSEFSSRSVTVAVPLWVQYNPHKLADPVARGVRQRPVRFRNSVEFNLAPQRCHLCPSFWPQARMSPKSCSNACSNPGGIRRHVAAPGGLRPRTR
jgi:hypothetical protein